MILLQFRDKPYDHLRLANQRGGKGAKGRVLLSFLFALKCGAFQGAKNASGDTD
jgi:hypothetical protein